MIDREALQAFLSLDALLFLGASRGGRKFGNILLRALVKRGTRVVPVHPEAPVLEGQPCLPSIERVEPPVEGAVLVLKPGAVLQALPALARAGVRQVWVQQGGESPAAEALASELGLSLIQGHCLLMFLPGAAWIHRAHHRIAAWARQVPA